MDAACEEPRLHIEGRGEVAGKTEGSRINGTFNLVVKINRRGVTRMIYLRKANSDVIDHCKCSGGYISSPGQMDCPWCGCGWLFTCSNCRKAFTFAEAVEVDFALEEMAERDLRHWKSAGRKPSAKEIQEWVGFMRLFLRDLELGKRYVYFDGVVLAADANGATFEGFHSSHDLAVVPQVEALRDQSIIRDLLRNPQYWRETALER